MSLSVRLGFPLRRWWCLCGLICLSVPQPAHADSPRLGFQLSRGAPTSAGSWQFLVERPWYAPTQRFAVGLTFAYDHNLLRLPDSDGPLVIHSLLGSLDVAVSPLRWLLIRANLPLSIYESGTADPTSGDVPIEKPALGDPGFGVTARLYGDIERDRVSLHAGIDGWPGMGQAAGQRRDGLPRHEGDADGRILLPRLVIAGIFAENGRFTVDSGFLYRPVAAIGSPGHTVVAGSEVQIGGALGFAPPGGRLYLGLETRLRARVTGYDVSDKDIVHLDVLLSGQTLLWQKFQLGAAIGTTLFGVGSSVSPQLTTLLRLALAPRHGDRDQDHDGIPDSQDRCPYEPEDKNGYRDDDGCPDALLAPPIVEPASASVSAPETAPSSVAASSSRPSPANDALVPNALLDSDGDGIPDREDLCPLVPEDRDGFEDEDGCPELDNDDDGIPDAQDVCPLEAETVNGRLDDDGCPERAQAKIDIGTNHLILKEQFLFRPNSAQLDPRSGPLLRELVQLLRDHPRLAIEIQGHTDNVGGAKRNLLLSQQRADAVRTHLIKSGIAATRLRAVGYGADKALVPNSSAKNRAVNRRVELWILSGGTP